MDDRTFEVVAHDPTGSLVPLDVVVHVPRIGAPRRLDPGPDGGAAIELEPVHRGDLVLARARGFAPVSALAGSRHGLDLPLLPEQRLRGWVDSLRFGTLAGATLQIHGELLERVVDAGPLPSVESLLGLGLADLDQQAGFTLDGLGREPRWVELWAPERWLGPLRTPFDDVWDSAERCLLLDGGHEDLLDLRLALAGDSDEQLPESALVTLWWDHPGVSTRSRHPVALDDRGRAEVLIGRRLLDRVTVDVRGRRIAELDLRELPLEPVEVTERGPSPSEHGTSAAH